MADDEEGRKMMVDQEVWDNWVDVFGSMIVKCVGHQRNLAYE